MRSALAILEIALVFVVGALASRAIPDGAMPDQLGPIARVALILVVASTLDRSLRRRGVAEWGLTLGQHETPEHLLTAVRLLVIAGVPALAVTVAGQRLGGGADWEAWSAAGLLTPILAQEVFLLGYAHARLADQFNARVLAAIVAVVFVAAHFGHAAERPYAAVFLAAMAWQGVWWSLTRTASRSIAPPALAHAGLLLLYAVPMFGLTVLTLLAALLAPRSGAWMRAVVSPLA